MTSIEKKTLTDLVCTALDNDKLDSYDAKVLKQDLSSLSNEKIAHPAQSTDDGLLTFTEFQKRSAKLGYVVSHPMNQPHVSVANKYGVVVAGINTQTGCLIVNEKILPKELLLLQKLFNQNK